MILKPTTNIINLVSSKMAFVLPLFSQTPPLMATIITFLLFIFFIILKHNSSKNKPPPPEAGGAWPTIGHLLKLKRPETMLVTLTNMADKYGPIFTIKLGTRTTLVVSSSDIAKECFTTNDKAFANRPKSAAMEILGFNFSMIGFCPYGPYWRKVRKLATIELLSNQRLESLNHVWESIVKSYVNDLHKLWTSSIDDDGGGGGDGDDRPISMEMKKWFRGVTENIIFKIIIGKSYVENTNMCWQKVLKEYILLTATFVVSDVFPILKPLDLGGKLKAMKKMAKELDVVAGTWLDEHKAKKYSNDDENKMMIKDDEDFMGILLSVLEGEDHKFESVDTTIKATCLALMVAGTDTTGVTLTLTWTLSLLLNNRDALKKTQQELDEHIGRERQVTQSDIQNLHYLQAVIKESLRLYPSAPLSLPHESLEDCVVNGYHIPKGTQLVVNISKIQRDPNAWPDEPNKFKPERFLASNVKDVRGHNFELIPFGSGRRICPGISLALQVVQLTLATLLHGFDIETPSNEVVDMGASFGVSNDKTKPLEVVLTPRLSSQLYE